MNPLRAGSRLQVRWLVACRLDNSAAKVPFSTLVLAPSAVTHRISTLHPYNTRQQTGLAGQQVTICETVPGKITPTEKIRLCAQAVMGFLTSCCIYKAAGCRKCQYADADPSSLKKKLGGKEEWGPENIKHGEERGRGAEKREQVRVEQDP